MTTSGPGNYTQYSNPEIDALFPAVYEETDPEKQQEMLNQAQEILMAAPNWIPIAEYPTQWGVREGISGIEEKASRPRALPAARRLPGTRKVW